MSELLVLGASHRSAPLSLRERLALTEDRAARLLQDLLDGEHAREAVAISTCNRVELYVVVGDPVEGETAVLGALARLAHVRPTELLDGIYTYTNCEAARHLFRVAAGLDSMVVGEAEVQGQVKRAYDAALTLGTTGPLTNRLFRAALATGKRVRTETAIGARRASVASVAVDLARGVHGELNAKHVLVIGAGETSELTAGALHEHGADTIWVANRHRDRALALAQRFDGRTVAFDDLPGELERADIVVSSTASTEPIVEAEDLERVVAARTGRPLLVIDIAVPRDFDPACRFVDGVELYDVDDLQEQADRLRAPRATDAAAAERIIEEEIQGFAEWLGSLEVLPMIGALRAHGEAIAAEVLAANDGRWESLSVRDRERVAHVARAIVNRLLHEPTMRVKAMPAGTRHARMQLLRELFGLAEPAALEDAPGAAPAQVHALPSRADRHAR